MKLSFNVYEYIKTIINFNNKNKIIINNIIINRTIILSKQLQIQLKIYDKFFL